VILGRGANNARTTGLPYARKMNLDRLYTYYENELKIDHIPKCKM
jgi:hypothetical protein